MNQLWVRELLLNSQTVVNSGQKLPTQEISFHKMWMTETNYYIYKVFYTLKKAYRNVDLEKYKNCLKNIQDSTESFLSKDQIEKYSKRFHDEYHKFIEKFPIVVNVVYKPELCQKVTNYCNANKLVEDSSVTLSLKLSKNHEKLFSNDSGECASLEKSVSAEGDDDDLISHQLNNTNITPTEKECFTPCASTSKLIRTNTTLDLSQ